MISDTRRAMVGLIVSTPISVGFNETFRVGLWRWQPFAFEILPADRYWIVTRVLAAANDSKIGSLEASSPDPETGSGEAS